MNGTETICAWCSTTKAAGPCCSAHDKLLCHLCYRRTHFVQVCVAGCRDCAAEGLPVKLSDLKTSPAAADAITLDTAAGAALAAQVQAEADGLDDAEPVEQVPALIADLIRAGWRHDTTTEIVSPDGVEYVLRRPAGPVAEVTLFATSARVVLSVLTEAEALAAIRAIGGAR